MFLLILLLLACNSTTTKNITNEPVINKDSGNINMIVTNEINKTIVNDTCIKRSSEDRYDCLSIFFQSKETCERGYSTKDSLNYYFKKIYLNSIDKYYLIAFFEKSNKSMIYEFQNGKWTFFHSIPDSLYFFFPNICQCSNSDFAVPSVKLVDLNGDKILDIQIIAFTNINGNEYSYLCITDTLNKTLNYIDYVFANPEFNYKINRLQEIELTSVGRNGFQAIYKFEGMTIIPDLMLEDDKSEVDWESTPAKGIKLNIYRGNGKLTKGLNKWTLIKCYKDPSDSVYSRWHKINGIDWGY